MLKIFLFFFKTGLLIGAAIWVANRPGTIEITWLDYRIETTMGIALLALAILIIVCAQSYRLWRNFLRVPSWWKNYSSNKDKEKGYESLTKGLVAIAAGDKKVAQKHSKRASRFIPDSALTKLLKAQSALLSDENEQAEYEFLKLIEDKQASFLGVRGLLTQKLNNGDMEGALHIVRHADTMQPKTKWILNLLFDLEIQARDWKGAEETLHKALKAKLFNKQQFKENKSVILLAQAELALANNSLEVVHDLTKQAFSLDTHFVPAICAYANILHQQGQEKKAYKVLEKAWKHHPHHDIGRMWTYLFEEETSEKTVEETLTWVSKLNKWQPNSYEGSMRYALSALSANQFEIARSLLEKLAETNPTELVFLVLSDLEIKENRNEAKASAWLKKANTAPKEEEWLCQSCHSEHKYWAPICRNCGEFNGLKWGVNDFNARTSHKIKLLQTNSFIEAPLS